MEVEKLFVNPANISGKEQRVRDDLKKIDQKIRSLEKKQGELFELLSREPGLIIKKLIIRQLNVGILELNLESIEVRDLGETLSIGMNLGADRLDNKEPGEKVGR